jgi:hypothetical protein
MSASGLCKPEQLQEPHSHLQGWDMETVRRLSGAPTSPSPRRPADQLMADSSWQTIVELPATDGRRYEYVLGILAPLTGQGCEYSKNAVGGESGVAPRLSHSGPSG